MRHCRIDHCLNRPLTGRRLCARHKKRIALHGDPDFHTWQVADDHDIQTVIQQQRPTEGLTRLERVRVAQGLTALGLPAEEIARILAVTPRTVYRWRARNAA
jgi:DNA-binding CsgD family transcriptional regulator